MSTYHLSGSGDQALTAGTGLLRVVITSLPALAGAGRANPANRFDVGLLRQGDGTSWWRAEAIDADNQLFPLLSDTTHIGYALLHGATIDLVEVAGASPFFPLPSLTLDALTDVSAAAPTNGQVLEWIAAHSAWEPATPVAGPIAPTVLLTFDQATDMSLATTTTTWNTWKTHTFTVTDNTAPIVFHVAGYTVGDNTGGHGIGSRLLLDSVTVFALSGMFGGNADPFGGGSTVYLGVLSAGSHSVDVQIRGDSADTIRCRPATRSQFGERYSVFVSQG